MAAQSGLILIALLLIRDSDIAGPGDPNNIESLSDHPGGHRIEGTRTRFKRKTGNKAICVKENMGEFAKATLVCRRASFRDLGLRNGSPFLHAPGSVLQGLPPILYLSTLRSAPSRARGPRAPPGHTTGLAPRI